MMLASSHAETCQVVPLHILSSKEVPVAAGPYAVKWTYNWTVLRFPSDTTTSGTPSPHRPGPISNTKVYDLPSPPQISFQLESLVARLSQILFLYNGLEGLAGGGPQAFGSEIRWALGVLAPIAPLLIGAPWRHMLKAAYGMPGGHPNPNAHPPPPPLH